MLDMGKAIATQLQSLISSELELIDFKNADPYWQQQISSAIIDPADSHLIFPQNIDTVATIIQQAQQQQWRILICGNGSKLNWGELTKDIQLVISIQKCDRLIEHAVGDLTVTVEAGMKLADLQPILRSHQQFLPIDPCYPDQATIGGIVATADTGSWRQRYGGIRDLVLGLSFIRADGKLAKAGGRVVKNVAGYDLMKLFTGAYGTLGLISQVTFRTYPLPESSQTLLLTGDQEAIARAMQTIRNSSLTPTALDLLSSAVMEQWDLGTDLGLILRWQTIAPSIEQQSATVQAIAKELSLTVRNYSNEDEISLWQQLSKTILISGTDSAIICKIGIVPQKAVGFLQQLTAISTNKTLAVIHGGSGIGKLWCEADNLNVLQNMRAYLEQNQGFLTILSASKSIKQQIDVWGYRGNALQTMQALKYQFDSNNILNPGRFVGKI
ncbi:MAG: FAD-binding oxidoreductase [Pleurocapsa sp.]